MGITAYRDDRCGRYRIRGLARHLGGNVVRYVPNYAYNVDWHVRAEELIDFLTEDDTPEVVIVHAPPEVERQFIEGLDGVLPLIVLGSEQPDRPETTEITEFYPIGIGSSSLAPKIDQLIERAHEISRHLGEPDETI